MLARLSSFSVLAILVLAGCHGAPAPEGSGPIPVTVAYPIARRLTDYAEYPGRTAAIESLDVRPRVSGYLQDIFFPEGTEVPKGALLYLIDPRPYEAAYNQAMAQQKLAEANLKYQEAV